MVYRGLHRKPLLLPARFTTDCALSATGHTHHLLSWSDYPKGVCWLIDRGPTYSEIKDPLLEERSFSSSCLLSSHPITVDQDSDRQC